MSMSIRPAGDALAAWIAKPTGSYTVYVAQYPVGGPWSLAASYSPVSADGTAVAVSLGVDGVLTWVDATSDAVLSSLNQGPSPPATATAQLLFDQYINSSDRVHLLQWPASLAPNVVGYQISTNGSLEASTSNTQIYLRNRIKGQLYNYSIVSVQSSGATGPALTIAAEG